MYKELAEHCRTIHLALVALCFGLLVAGASGLDSSELLAHKEVLTVSTIVEKLRNKWWATTISDKFSTAFSGDLSRNLRIRELFLRDNEGTVYQLPILNSWFLTRSDATVQGPVDIRPDDIPNYVLGYQAVSTLDDFAKTWTLLSTHRNLVALELTLGGVRISTRGASELSIPTDQEDPGLAAKPARESPAALLSHSGAIERLGNMGKDIGPFSVDSKTTELVASAIRYLESKVSRNSCILLSRGSRSILIVQCDCESRSPPLQKELAANINPSPPPGTYSASFPNLAKATTWIDQSPIDKLEKHLYDRAFTVGEKVDIFGAKISESAVASWGLVALGSVFTWFLVHLAKLASFSRASVSKAEPPAWIGLYDDLLSRVAFAITSFALPFAASVLLIRIRLQSPGVTLHSWDVLVSLALTCVLFLAGIHVIARLWKINWIRLIRWQRDV